MRGFQKYSPFYRTPKFPTARFPASLRRAFPATSDVSRENRHHHEVDLVVLYTVLLSFSRIHHRLIVPLRFSFSVDVFRRTSPWTWSSPSSPATRRHHGTLPRPGPIPTPPCLAPLLVSAQDGRRRPVPCVRACSGRQPPAEPALVQCAAAVGPSAAAAPPASRQAEAEPPPFPAWSSTTTFPWPCLYVRRTQG